jgi:broad specificity phosphatase PhoE
MLRIVAVVAALLAAGTAQAMSDAVLVEALRGGGFNIYFRHAQTEWSQEDKVARAGDWTSCDPARMRQLSEAGRATARRIGEAIRRLAIPVGKVMTSQYCRTAETAREMGIGTVETTTEIMNMRAAGFLGGREAVAELARRVLATPPAPDSNTVLVAHGNLMQAAAGAYTGEAGAGVFRPQPDGGWARLAERFGK